MTIAARLRKQPVGPYDPWNFSLEDGDRVYQWIDHKKGTAIMLDLYESSGWHKKTAGELSSRVVKKNGKPRRAMRLRDDLWYWIDERNQ